jgi:hypothetical protein
MTFEEIFIQKEGAMKVTIGIIGVPYEIFISMVMILFHYEKMVVHKNF